MGGDADSIHVDMVRELLARGRDWSAPLTVVADRDMCIGSGICASLAEGAFDVDDDGVVIVNTGQVDELPSATIELVISRCPVAAISRAETDTA